MLAGVLAAFTGIQSSSAAPITGVSTLQDLINLGSTGVTIGDKQFYDFSYVGSPTGGSNPSPTASQISVATAPGSEIGLTFSSSWESALGENQDSVVSYAVKTLPGAGMLIDDVTLRFNGNAVVPGANTLASVTETVSSLNSAGNGPGTFLGQLSTVNSGAGASTNKNVDTLTLATPTSGLFIRKDIQVNSNSGGTGGVATISFVDNTFSQTVPEPASFGLLALGAFGLIARRRR